MNLVDGIMRELNSHHGDRLQNELELLLPEQQHNYDLINKERDLNIYRSGSAPPTVEGSLSAVGSLLRDPNFSINSCSANTSTILSEEEIRSHPAYLSYYYSNDNLNPRLPPPLLSREDWRLAQRFQAGGSSFGGFGDWPGEKTVNIDDTTSLLSTHPSLSLKELEDELLYIHNVNSRGLSRASSTECLDRGSDGLTGLQRVGMGVRRKSFADILQEGLARPGPKSGLLSRPASCSSFSEIVNKTQISSRHVPDIYNNIKYNEALHLHPKTVDLGLPRVRSFGSAVSQSPIGSPLSRNRAPNPQKIGRPQSPCVPSGSKRVSLVENKNIASPNIFELGDIAAPISKLSLLNNQVDCFDSVGIDVLNPPLNVPDIDKPTSAMFTFPPSFINGEEKNAVTGEKNVSGLGLHGPLNFSQTSSPVNTHYSYLDAGFDLKSSNQVLPDHHSLRVDPGFIQYMQRVPHSAKHTIVSLGDHFGTSHPDGSFQTLQNAYIDALLAHQENQYDISLTKESNNLHQGYHLNPDLGLHTPPEGKVAAKHVLPSGGSKGPTMRSRRNSQFNMLRTNIEDVLSSSLLEELKSNGAKSLELVDIVDKVVEFSMDQYGSRFIQQKLETATTEEKVKIFPEIISNASALMTDVFGNYVIQKFFEYGTESQRKNLARQLVGHVLPLSLQMYGCRVIQKALEVLDVEQQTLLVVELDGSIMKCVHDQNGNHVIQKCIERVPQDRIQFIISSFFGKIVALSTHTYGCRVVQRVLEHCNDPKTQQVIMEEILHSACSLAQDQYGNYVIQHVLQHGNGNQRSAVVRKLAGQVVQMSQQKFASNVVEKCFTFGGAEERQLLLNEMLGARAPDKNEPLQAMMKDPFGNYVVQKVLETCDDKSGEAILSHIKGHLNTLKRYTYGKHLVARVEKLVAAEGNDPNL